MIISNICSYSIFVNNRRIIPYFNLVFMNVVILVLDVFKEETHIIMTFKHYEYKR